jgi:GNAT superfamily N-acetyltransferase
MIDSLPAGLTARHLAVEDHLPALAAVGPWWGGLKGDAGAAERALLLPRLYFQHFTTTSFLVEHDGSGDTGGSGGNEGEIAAFLIGFLSQTDPETAYVHFTGVAPKLHGQGLGRALYLAFFKLARSHGRRYVHCVTSPENTASQAFHTRIGFTASAVKPDYDGPGFDRVTFSIDLSA